MTDTSHKNVGPKLWAMVIALLAVLLAFWWFSNKPQPGEDSGTNAQEKIIVGYLPIYVDLPLFVAKEEGLFEKRGLNIELVKFESSPDMGSALVSGQIDAVASIATPTALTTEDRDAGRFKIFMVDQATIENPLSSLMLPAGSKVQSIADLKGKTVGSFPGPTTTTLSPLAFSVDGLNPSDYRLVDIPPKNHLELLNAGTVDALVTYEPTATQAEKKNGAIRLVKGFIEAKLMNPWPAGSWLISAKLLETDDGRQQARLFAEAIYEATDMLRNDPDTMKVHLSNYTLIDQDIARAAPNIAFTKSSEADGESLQGYANLLFREGVVKKRPRAKDLLISF